MARKNLTFWAVVTILNLSVFAFILWHSSPKAAEAQSCIDIQLVRCTGDACVPSCPGGGGYNLKSYTLVGQTPAAYSGQDDIVGGLCWPIVP